MWIVTGALCYIIFLCLSNWYDIRISFENILTQDVVTLLLQHDADVSIINAEGHTARSLAKTKEIYRLIEGTSYSYI